MTEPKKPGLHEDAIILGKMIFGLGFLCGLVSVLAWWVLGEPQFAIFTPFIAIYSLPGFGCLYIMMVVIERDKKCDEK